MSEFNVMFNGHDITKYLRVLEGFDRGIGSERINDTRQSGNEHGKKYNGFRYDEKFIPMPFMLRNDLLFKREELAKILDVSEPASLIFGDEPHKEYFAIPTGDITVDEKNFLGFGTITWQIPDGLAHSITESNHTWDDLDAPPVVIKSDFAGKEAGSEVECPHYLRYAGNVSLLTPNQLLQYGLEASQVGYNNLKKIDNQLFQHSTIALNQQAQAGVSLNILSVVKRAYPFLFEGLSESAQVEKFKSMFESSIVHAHGKGSSPLGNKLSAGIWNNRVGTYSSYRWANTSANIVDLNIDFNLIDYINDKGLAEIILYAEPSDGTTPSSVSLDYTNVEITLKLPDGNVVTIVNNGNVATELTYEFEHTSENGYLTAMNQLDESWLIGDPTEVDGTTEQKSVVLISDRMREESKANWELNEGKIFFTPQKGKVDGDFTWQDFAAHATSYGNYSDGRYHGPTLSRAIPSHNNTFISENWGVKFRVGNTPQGPQKIKNTSRQESFVLDENKNFIAGFYLADKYQAKDKLVPTFVVGDQIVWEDSETVGWEDFYGECLIQKFGNKFSFKLYKMNNNKKEALFEYESPEVAKMNPRHLNYWSGVWSTDPHTKNYLADVVFWRHNVPYWNEISNKFQTDDVVLYDGTTGKVTLNEAPFTGELDLHSTNFKAQPGKNKLYFGWSDFATRPKLNIKIRKKWRA